MGKSLRWSETWFRRGLWLVAVVFASFLIGLGSAVVDDLPQVEQRLELDDFLDLRQAQPLRNEQESLRAAQRQALEARDQAQLRWQQARSDTQAARDTFSNWIATRSATQRSEQDPEVIRRTQALEQLRQTERQAQQQLQDQEQALLNARQQSTRVHDRLQALEDTAHEALQRAQRAQELRVFLYRLALTLPLLVLAGWLFVKKRKSPWWPFVWGFIFFAGFAFFVELVPYLPSYGGYVRYGVGLLLTAVLGHYAIRAMRRYLEQQQAQEALPDAQRRQQLDYELTHTRLAKGLCPGCERAIPLQDPQRNFCMHCGLKVFMPCTRCGVRMPALARFCPGCGSVPSADGSTA